MLNAVNRMTATGSFRVMPEHTEAFCGIDLAAILLQRLQSLHQYIRIIIMIGYENMNHQSVDELLSLRAPV